MATTGFSFLDLLSDKNFQNLLAGIGTQLGGPGSIGAALGTSTIAFNKAKAAQAAAEATLERNATAEAAPSALKSVIDTPTTAEAVPRPALESLLDTTAPAVPKLSYAVKEPSVLANEVADLLTPPDVPGPTSVARDKSGNVNVKYTPAASLLPTNEVESLLSDYLPPQTTMADLENDYTQPRRLPRQQLASLDAQGDILASLGPSTQRAAEPVVPAAVASKLDTHSTKYGTDSNLVKAIALQESGGVHRNPDGTVKVSSKGARGTMQLMRKTAARLGVDPDNEEQNLEGGVREIANLQKLSSNPKDILAGYVGGENGMRMYQSQKATTPVEKETLAYINSYVNQTYARYQRMQAAQSVPAQVADLTGSTEVISGGGIPEVPKGTRMSIPNVIYTPPPATTEVAKPAPRPAEASTGGAPSTQSGPKSQAEQVADLLNLPMSTEMPTGNAQSPLAESIAIPIEKKSPPAPAPKLTQLAPKIVREQYDLRGLSPDEVDKVVGRAIEAERADIARSVDKRENTQLIETDDGYLVLNKRTREITPLTREGKLDAAKDLQLKRYDTLSEFTREMSKVPGTDPVVRSKMTDSQSKDFAYGSRALQANERQRKLEQRQAAGKGDNPEKFATRRATILQTLESLPPDMPMNVVGTVLGATGAIGDMLLNLPQNVKDGWNKLVTGEMKWDDLGAPVRAGLEAVGLGPAAARVYASLNIRGGLTDDEREFMQNSIEFSTALLRRDSGAAIGGRRVPQHS